MYKILPELLTRAEMDLTKIVLTLQTSFLTIDIIKWSSNSAIVLTMGNPFKGKRINFQNIKREGVMVICLITTT